MWKCPCFSTHLARAHTVFKCCIRPISSFRNPSPGNRLWEKHKPGFGIRWICVVTGDGSSFFRGVCNINPTMWHQSVLSANCQNIYFNTIVLYVWLFMRWNVLELNINLVPPILLHWSLVCICEHFKNTNIQYMSEKGLFTFWWHHIFNVLYCRFYCSSNRLADIILFSSARGAFEEGKRCLLQRKRSFSV